MYTVAWPCRAAAFLTQKNNRMRLSCFLLHAITSYTVNSTSLRFSVSLFYWTTSVSQKLYTFLFPELKNKIQSSYHCPTLILALEYSNSHLSFLLLLLFRIAKTRKNSSRRAKKGLLHSPKKRLKPVKRTLGEERENTVTSFTWQSSIVTKCRKD